MRPPRDKTFATPPDAMDGATDLLVGAQAIIDEDLALPGQALQVVGIGKSTFTTVALPGSGAFAIGRSPDCTLRIDDGSISRRHAMLHVASGLEIEDVGSRNGTVVKGRKLVPYVRIRIALGEIVRLGNIAVVVQERSSDTRVRNVCTLEEFETRLAEECARAERTGVPVGVLRVQTSDVSPQDLQGVLSESLRLSDVIAYDGVDAYKILLPEIRHERLIGLRDRLAEQLQSRGIKCEVTHTSYPRDATSPRALLSRIARPPTPGNHPEIVVRDPVVQELHALAQRVAVSNISVLLLGETGVGKDVLAERIHYASPRADKPFLQLNCAGLTETMLDSELFGHEKGAFTGAVAMKEGLLESAHGGTVFLDEIGDMPQATQVKLLRIIEDGRTRRVGGVKSRPIDIRFVAATNRELEADVEAGRFRRDLYFRLNGITMVMPPLRERIAEIEPLAQLFANRAAMQAGARAPTFTAEALELLRAHTWPGNIRELRNVISRAVILAGNGPIGTAALPVGKMQAPPTRAIEPRTKTSTNPPALGKRPRRGTEEAEWIRRGLELANGNQTQAAKLLGISRRTLINRIIQYGFERPRR